MRIYETTYCRKLVRGGNEQAKIQIQTSGFWSQKKTSNGNDLVAREIRTNRKKNGMKKVVLISKLK